MRRTLSSLDASSTINNSNSTDAAKSEHDCSRTDAIAASIYVALLKHGIITEISHGFAATMGCDMLLNWEGVAAERDEPCDL